MIVTDEMVRAAIAIGESIDASPPGRKRIGAPGRPLVLTEKRVRLMLEAVYDQHIIAAITGHVLVQLRTRGIDPEPAYDDDMTRWTVNLVRMAWENRGDGSADR